MTRLWTPPPKPAKYTLPSVEAFESVRLDRAAMLAELSRADNARTCERFIAALGHECGWSEKETTTAPTMMLNSVGGGNRISPITFGDLLAMLSATDAQWKAAWEAIA